MLAKSKTFLSPANLMKGATFEEKRNGSKPGSPRRGTGYDTKSNGSNNDARA